MSGFIALHRDAFAHPVLKDPARFKAWFQMVAKACWKTTRFDVRGKSVELNRGQFCASRDQLAAEFGWSPSAVERFLARLETEQMIGRETGQGKSIITICNYDVYNPPIDEAGQESGQQAGQKSDRNRTAKEQGKQGNKENNNKGTDLPEWLPADAWAGFVQMRKVIKKPMTDRAAKMIIKTVGDLVEQGFDAAAVLDQSTRNNWQDVYALKAGSKANQLDYGPC